MKILDRYVLVSFLKNYIIALMVLLGCTSFWTWFSTSISWLM